jgi:2-(1,2-epoxy-1,2-dihydrophenyl)acetyl-CoA isomerase
MVLFQIASQVATITFDRPDVFNSMNHAMRQIIIGHLEACHRDPDVRCVVLTGNGRAFCAGQDLQEVVDPNGPSMTRILQEGYNPIVTAIKQMPKPVVAAVNGIAAGAGANIALACDITIAKQSAAFTQAFSKIGLVPDSGGTWTLPRLVGLQRATALMMLSDKISADEAASIGMIWKSIPDEQFDAEITRVASTLSQMPTTALAYTKQAIAQSFGNTFEQQLEVEDTLQTEAGQSYDYQEGVAAFLAKRKPVFRGF